MRLGLIKKLSVRKFISKVSNMGLESTVSALRRVYHKNEKQKERKKERKKVKRKKEGEKT